MFGCNSLTVWQHCKVFKLNEHVPSLHMYMALAGSWYDKCVPTSISIMSGLISQIDCVLFVWLIWQFDSMRVLQSCEMVSTCTELTYVLGLAGGGYVECVVWWNDPLLFISCQDPFPKSLRNAKNVESNGQLYMVCRVCRWLFLSWKKKYYFLERTLLMRSLTIASFYNFSYNMYKAKLYLRKLKRN